jgi:hypothetical protein
VTAQLEAVKAERDKITVPLQPFTLEHCIPNDNGQNLENKVVIIRPERLRPNTAPPTSSLCWPREALALMPISGVARSTTVNLYSGKESRWNREDILGILKPEYMPIGQKERLIQIQAESRQNRKNMGRSV